MLYDTTRIKKKTGKYWASARCNDSFMQSCGDVSRENSEVVQRMGYYRCHPLQHLTYTESYKLRVESLAISQSAVPFANPLSTLCPTYTI